MKDKKHPMIYLLANKKDDSLAGHYANARLCDFRSFSGTEDLFRQLISLVEQSYFEEAPKNPNEYSFHKFPQSGRLFIIEILYCEYENWQGCIRGMKEGAVPFKSREDMIEKILQEMIKNTTQIVV